MENEPTKRKIVSSRHLATTGGWQLSEFEFGLIVAYNGFSRWVNRCMAASGYPALGTLEDAHTVNYAIKKLVKQGLVSGEKSGKEMLYSTTEEGVDLCNKYCDTREQCLIESLNADGDELREIAATLRTLSGVYDQAARAASSL